MASWVFHWLNRKWSTWRTGDAHRLSFGTWHFPLSTQCLLFQFQIVPGSIGNLFWFFLFYIRHCWSKIKSSLSRVMLSFSFSYHIIWDTTGCVETGIWIWVQFLFLCAFPSKKITGLIQTPATVGKWFWTMWPSELGWTKTGTKFAKKANFPSGYSKDLPCFTKIYYRNALKPSNWILKSMGVQSVDIKKVPWVVSNFKTLSFL